MAKPYTVMTEALTATAERLNPIIQSRLSPQIKQTPWPEVLKILDDIKGFQAKSYEPYDLQPQLRILTVNLKKLGDPFFDGSFRVQKLANALKSYRGLWAHMAPLTLDDCWNAADIASDLLQALADTAGASHLAAMRARIEALIRGNHIELTPDAFAPESRAVRDLIDEPVETGQEQPAAELVSPDPAMFKSTRQLEHLDAGEQAVLTAVPSIADERGAYFPWQLVRVGEPWVITELPKKLAKAHVRALAVDIVEFEGPVQLDRLCRLIASSYGIGRLYPRRLAQIASQVRVTEGLTVDAQKFVWPGGMEPTTWREFRPNDSSIGRRFETISPIELANAGEFILNEQAPRIQRELEVAILRTFGRKALTTEAKKHLKLAMSEMRNRKLTLPPEL